MEGKSIRLRPMEHEDMSDLHRWWTSPQQSGEFLTFEALDKASFEKFVTEASVGPFLLRILMIEKLDGQSKTGYVTHFNPHPFSSCMEIGYVIVDSERKKGYATEASKLIVDYLFKTRNIERIQALVDTRNAGSQRVLEKNGFRREGQMRKLHFVNGHFADNYIYSILREEWTAMGTKA